MQVISINSQFSPNFGIKVSLETIRRANQTCIENTRLARTQGLSLAKYRELHKEDCHTIGSVIARYIIVNKAMLNKAYSNALKEIKGKIG